MTAQQLTPAELRDMLKAQRCPACKAEPGAKCVTATGKPREWCESHYGRIRMAWAGR